MNRRRLAFLILALVGAGCSQPEDVDRSVSSALARELIEMAADDQQVRKELARHLQESGAVEVPSQLQQRLHKIDSRNLARMKEIVAEHGWPTHRLVGPTASEAAWLLVQHGDAAPDFQRHVLELITPLVRTGDVSADRFAMLTDRTLVAAGKPQLYGTQYIAVSVDGVVHFGPRTPISDPANLLRRRSELGLPCHSKYVQELRVMIGVPESAPPLPPGIRSATLPE